MQLKQSSHEVLSKSYMYCVFVVIDLNEGTQLERLLYNLFKVSSEY